MGLSNAFADDSLDVTTIAVAAGMIQLLELVVP